MDPLETRENCFWAGVQEHTTRPFDGRAGMSGRILDPPGQYPVMADPLLAALESPCCQSRILGRIHLPAPWGIRVDGPNGWFYQVAGGPCVLQVEGCPQPVSVFDGDFLVLPPHRGHSWKDCPESPAVLLSDLLGPRHRGKPETIAARGSEPHTSLFAGSFLFDGTPGQSPLDRALPSFAHITSRAGGVHRSIQYLLKMIDLESASGKPYAQVITNHLVQVLVMKVVQRYFGLAKDGEVHLLQARLDPRIDRALSLIHDRPECPWTVAVLAERAAMSRSAFCVRFASLVGKPPLEYLTEWRMHRACQLLRGTPAGLKEVAVRVGYGSAAAFGKAFARWAGTTPHAYRSGSGAAGSFQNGPGQSP
jgi:AraC-like DNA-binding protein